MYRRVDYVLSPGALTGLSKFQCSLVKVSRRSQRSQRSPDPSPRSDEASQTLEPHKWGWFPSVVPQPLHRNKAPFLFLLNYNNFVILCWFFLLLKYFLSRFCLPPPPSFFKMLITLSAAWTVSYPRGCAPLLMETNSSSAGRGCVSKHLLSVYGQMLVLCKKTIRKKTHYDSVQSEIFHVSKRGLEGFTQRPAWTFFLHWLTKKSIFLMKATGKGQR